MMFAYQRKTYNVAFVSLSSYHQLVYNTIRPIEAVTSHDNTLLLTLWRPLLPYEYSCQLCQTGLSRHL